ncbi:ribosome biogenesis GTP-binding protein YihA/YsxC [Desulfobacter latus]|uniref:Probable GTP-binding protein EngB n=1 Tax=Desulfobacter latus TaxID=2292 RepID=A0A850SPV7_9BACT|nr:ribosome biogenesis GTP-binding protein YihA/YsxC [Desulfobacter latus]NWH03504.1 YihA family ribosome biogenesis GTP-binding protein [Desulfobacter latus]
MKIRAVEFIKSAVKPAHYPEYDFPEIAFAGRSNVGKSSLINTLINRKDMVKTSSRPGCTQLINFFLVNEALSLVDLPGYGYAKVSKKIRAQWQPMVETYVETRKNLLGLILLMDIRRDPGKEELDMVRWLETNQMPCLLILTKADKLSKTKQLKQLDAAASAFNRDRNGIVLFSAKTRQGRQTIWDEIHNLIDWYQKEQ